MRMVDLINKKKRGEALSAAEIDYIVQGYTKGEIPDYQMSAFLMAVYFKGMKTVDGGVGDKPVAKMSGRGLGHTGGTIDKLESIEG